jgi:hypothetical protein
MMNGQIIDYQFITKAIIHHSSVSHLENRDTIGERIGRIGQIETDFLDPNARISSKKSKKIRSDPPDPPNPFSHCISIFQMRNCCSSFIIHH